MSAPVPDIGDLLDDSLLEMEALHQQLLKKEIIREKLVDSFMDSLDRLSDEDKLRKVQRRIPILKNMLSTPISSFVNGGEISEKSPVQSQSDSLAPVQVKQEFARPAAGFAQNFAESLAREVPPRTEQPYNARLLALRNIVFQRWWCYERMLEHKPKNKRNILKLPDLYEAWEVERPGEKHVPPMKHVHLKSTITNLHLNKTGLVAAIQHKDIRRATICVGDDQWIEPPDCGSETGTLRPEYTAQDPNDWKPKPKPRSRKRSQQKKPDSRESKRKHGSHTSCRETKDSQGSESDRSSSDSDDGIGGAESRAAKRCAAGLASGGNAAGGGGIPADGNGGAGAKDGGAGTAGRASGGNAAGGGGAADGTVDSTAPAAAGAAPANKEGGAGATDGAGAKDGGAGATYGGAGATDCGTGATDGGAGAAPPLDSASSGGNAAGGGRGGRRAAAGGGGRRRGSCQQRRRRGRNGRRRGREGRRRGRVGRRPGRISIARTSCGRRSRQREHDGR